MSTLRARLRLDRQRFTLDVDLDVPGRGVTAVFGPSGSGKSTLLRCLAGLEPDADGTVQAGAEVWQDRRRGVFVPPHRRGVGYVFQEADLFRHLNVRGNLRYAARRAGERPVSWEDSVSGLGLEHLLDRDTNGLSGGERQRVAIARALLAAPRLLLLDEPVSAVDEVSRREILRYLDTLARRLAIPIIYVSHSLREVLRLADHMVWLVDGRSQRSGAPAEVVGDADFGAWQGDEAAVVVDAVVRTDEEGNDTRFGLTLLEGPWGAIWARRQPHEPGASVRVQIRASDVSLALEREHHASILNQFPLEVLALNPEGPSEVLVTLARSAGAPVLLARISRLSCERLDLAPGAQVFARVKSVVVVD